MYLKSTITLTIPLVVVIACLRIYSVQAYVSYVPSSRESDDDTYDVTNQQPQNDFDGEEEEVDDDVLFRLLNRIISKSLHRNQQQKEIEDIYGGDSSFIPSVYRPSKRVPANYLKQKRKVFWQPLGYYPPGASSPGRQGVNPSSAGGSRSQVFRYGK